MMERQKRQKRQNLSFANVPTKDKKDKKLFRALSFLSRRLCAEVAYD